MKEIKCAFCNGKGIDPFELLSPSSICTICGGKGIASVEEPYIECAFCRGTGVYPHTRLSCTVCMGKGVITVIEPKATCPECKGTGQERLTNLPCLRCGGRGVIREEGETPGGRVGRKAIPKGASQMAEDTPGSTDTEVKMAEGLKVFQSEGKQNPEDCSVPPKKAEKSVRDL